MDGEKQHQLKNLMFRFVRGITRFLQCNWRGNSNTGGDSQSSIVRRWRSSQRDFLETKFDLSTQPLELSEAFSHLKKIPGMVGQGNPEELLLLFGLAFAMDGDENIVEVGSWLGRSAAFLGLGSYLSSSSKVICVDHFRGNPGKESLYFGPVSEKADLFRRFQTNIAHAGLDTVVKPVKGESTIIGRKFKEKIKLLFLDGCHNYEAVRDDFLVWEPHVRIGGYICFDDYSPKFPGVVRFIENDLKVDARYRVIGAVGKILIAKKLCEK